MYRVEKDVDELGCIERTETVKPPEVDFNLHPNTSLTLTLNPSLNPSPTLKPKFKPKPKPNP
jgi:hypothetical protein